MPLWWEIIRCLLIDLFVRKSYGVLFISLHQPHWRCVAVLPIKGWNTTKALTVLVKWSVKSQCNKTRILWKISCHWPYFLLVVFSKFLCMLFQDRCGWWIRFSSCALIMCKIRNKSSFFHFPPFLILKVLSEFWEIYGHTSWFHALIADKQQQKNPAHLD